MKAKDKVSVIVPIYNIEKYICTCVDSILNQTYKNLEIILVDDGSTDGCPALCDSYAEKDGRVKVLHKENEGQMIARKLGLSNAEGDFFAFVDGDDFVEKNMIEKMLEALQKENADIVLCGYKRVFSDRTFETHLFETDKIFDENESKVIHRRMIGMTGQELCKPENHDRLVTVWGKLYSKKCAENGLVLSERKIGSLEDAVYNLGAFEKCKKAVYIDENLYCYRRDNVSSFSESYKKDLSDKWEVLYDYFEAYIGRNGLPEEYQDALYNRIALGMLGLTINELKNPENDFKKALSLRKIMNMPRRKEALKKLKLGYFPVHWKAFYLCAKLHFGLGLVIIGRCINVLRRHLK